MFRLAAQVGTIPISLGEAVARIARRRNVTVR